ncbi:hypothetical protein F5Y14DRAFT_466320 [Nemania sp. NC0429]|nr:hypothetical protein F5Y14DRAFT_466320 [Nemania sp. NC0429]
MLPDGGPYFTEDDRPYFIVSGQVVWAASGQRNPDSENSGRGIAHSVVSDFESHRFHPGSCSDPPTRASSAMRARMMTGFPPRFNAGQSQGSAPGDLTNDYYRDGMKRKENPHGPSFDSDFVQRYNEYKDLDVAAEASQDHYNAYVMTASRTTRMTRNANPGVYGGNPPETQDWHRSAALYAERAATKHREAVDGRSHVAAAYLAYETGSQAKNHNKRECDLGKAGRKFERKYRAHSSTHYED